MDDYEKYIIEVEKNQKNNEKHLRKFEKWLRKNKLSDKTIRNHLNNASLYINDYLNYYDATPAEDGVGSVTSFLGGWFIKKCLWSSANSIKTTAASIKKFYQYMCENNHISKEDYDFLCKSIKDEMDGILEEMAEYEEELYSDYFW